MTTFPLPTLSATVNAQGISAPLYADILTSLQVRVRAIYGQDLDLDPDTQDGQFLAIFAQAIYDQNQAMVATYNNQSPATAVGAGLSSIVKINGIAREVPTNSTADLIVVGQAGLTISGGQARDANGLVWDLPAVVYVGAAGEVVVTATCETPGAVLAESGTINTIATPQPGWQLVSNPYAAVPGAPVETDLALRVRQALSVALPDRTVLDGINAALAAVTGVIRLKTYENDTAVTDQYGIPSHSIAPVVEGGDVFQICTAIALKKAPGTGTYGSLGEVILDQQGVPNFIKFFPLRLVEIYVEVTLTALQGYASTMGSEIINQVSSFISTLPIGYEVYLTKVVAATEIPEADGGLAYDVTKVRLARAGDFSFDIAGVGFDQGYWYTGFGAIDVPILFDEAAQTRTVDVTLIVNPS